MDSKSPSVVSGPPILSVLPCNCLYKSNCPFKYEMASPKGQLISRTLEKVSKIEAEFVVKELYIGK